ncbi:MAG: energy transducer TonB [Bryobacteraceae bacterium]|nr:energy transducer TonB [Bryobacteraceae bacterium]
MKNQNVVAAAVLLTFSCFGVMADVRVSSSDGLKAATIKPAPVYSPIARQMKVGGHVEVEAVVGTDGSVENVKAITGNPLLTQSAVQAVQKWKFTPFTANGEVSKAVVTLSFDFKP